MNSTVELFFRALNIELLFLLIVSTVTFIITAARYLIERPTTIIKDNNGPVYITSITSGNKLPAEIVMKSKIRRFFFLSWIKVECLGTDMRGPKVYTGWYLPHDIGGYSV